MINSQKVASEVSEHLAVFLQRGQNPKTLTWFSFVNSKAALFKVQKQIPWLYGPFWTIILSWERQSQLS